MLNLPSQLTAPFVYTGHTALKTLLGLTVYIDGPTEAELDWLCDYYERICPRSNWNAFKITELIAWSSVHSPDLTQLGRQAAAAGVRRPYIEPVRQRIRDARAFDVMFWDRRGIEDPAGSWSMVCRRTKWRDTGLHAFMRILIPLEADHELLHAAALEIADNVAFASGHAGLTFSHEPMYKPLALDEAYRRAKRYWCVDIEDLSASLRLMRNSIKGVGWLTLIGNQLNTQVEGDLSQLVRSRPPRMRFDRQRHGLVIRADDEPIAGDHNQNDPRLQAYFEIARALSPLYPQDVPDFAGQLFGNSGDSTAWVRRFIEPANW